MTGRAARFRRKSSQAKSREALPMWRCEDCGKGAYPTRKGARAASKANHPQERMTAYECPSMDGVWHYGHLRADVVAGRVGREVYVR